MTFWPNGCLTVTDEEALDSAFDIVKSLRLTKGTEDFPNKVHCSYTNSSRLQDHPSTPDLPSSFSIPFIRKFYLILNSVNRARVLWRLRRRNVIFLNPWCVFIWENGTVCENKVRDINFHSFRLRFLSVWVPFRTVLFLEEKMSYSKRYRRSKEFVVQRVQPLSWFR